MANLIYSAIMSLDGYIEDQSGKFAWAVPDAAVHGFINDLERAAGTYLYGRRMDETMADWETDPSVAAESPWMGDFAAIWRAADKIVYSRTLETVSTARTQLKRDFDPEAVRQLKATTNRTSSSAALLSQPMRSGRGWLTSATCSSCPSWWAAANGPFPTMSAWRSNWWRNAGLATAWFTCATGSSRDQGPQAPEIRPQLD